MANNDTDTLRSGVGGAIAVGLFAEGHGPRVPDEFIEERPELRGEGRVANAALLVESLLYVGYGEGHRKWGTPHRETNETELREAVDAAETARGHRRDADRLAAEDAGVEIVKGVLERPRIRPLVFGRDD